MRVLGMLRFRDWPVRRKIVALLIAASLIPLSVSATLQLRQARARLRGTVAELLAARADQLARQIETFHHGYALAATRLGLLPVMTASRAAPSPAATA
jgi:hypothetical protein